MDAAVAALLGAAIGAAGVVGAAWVQQWQQTQRELARTAADLAIADFAQEVERKNRTGGVLAPMSIYVGYHASVLRAVAQGKFDVDVEAVARINEVQKVLLMAIHDIRKSERRRQKKVT
jgi:hypothetical protein